MVLLKMIKKIFIILLAYVMIFVSVSCWLPDHSSINTTVTIVPYETTMVFGERKRFATLIVPIDNEDKNVIWNLSDPVETGSTIDENGNFTAGSTKGTVLVRATLIRDLSISGFAFVEIIDDSSDQDPNEPVDPNEPDPNEPVDPNVIFYDNFDGDILDATKWTHMTGTKDLLAINAPEQWGNGESQYYSANNSVVSNSTLKINAVRENIGDRAWSSSRITTRGKFSFTFGRVETRIKLPVFTGFWPAFWMMPDEPMINGKYQGNWPTTGEIDIMEARGRVPNKISSAIHYNDNGHNYLTDEYTFSMGDTIADFHIYAVEWHTDRIDFYVDEVLYYSEKNWKPFPAPFNSNFHIILNLAVGGHFDQYLMPPDNVDLGVMEIDYVKVTRF